MAEVASGAGQGFVTVLAPASSAAHADSLAASISAEFTSASAVEVSIGWDGGSHRNTRVSISSDGAWSLRVDALDAR